MFREPKTCLRCVPTSSRIWWAGQRRAYSTGKIPFFNPLCIPFRMSYERWSWMKWHAWNKPSNTLVLNTGIVILLVSNLPSVLASQLLIVAQPSSFHSSWKNCCTIDQEIWSLLLVLWDCNRFHGVPCKNNPKVPPVASRKENIRIRAVHLIDTAYGGEKYRRSAFRAQRLFAGWFQACWTIPTIPGDMGNKNPTGHLKHF